MDNFEKARSEARVGDVKKEYVDYLKHLYITEILQSGTKEGTNALVAYAAFLNRSGINSDNYPLYMRVLETNNRFAIDKLLEGHQPETYIDCVIPNHFIVEAFFQTLTKFKKNEVYRTTLLVIFGFLFKVYRSPEEGYQLYQPTIADVNNLGKYLDESKDQDDELNRGILDVLSCLFRLDMPYETDPQKKDLARQVGQIRSDFFDTARSLSQSMTDTLLEEADAPDYGTPPDYEYR